MSKYFYTGTRKNANRASYACCGTEKPAERGEVESALRRYLLYIYIYVALAASPSLLTSGRCGNPPGGGHRN